MVTQRKYDLVKAIIELEDLLNDEINSESSYQEYFESNSIVFKILGFLTSIPFTKSAKKRLPKDEYTGLQPEPDFIIQNKRSLYEIFELKTPFSKKLLVTSNKYRERFTAEIISYIEQTITYENYFSRNPANRENVRIQFGIEIQDDLPINIIIGLSDDIDRKKVNKLISQFTYKINIITFDEILDELKNEYTRTYGKYEGLKGFSVEIVFNLVEENKHSKHYIFDTGSIKKNRISLYYDKNKDICFEVIPNNGKSHKILIDSDEHNTFEKLVFVQCEFAKTQDGFHMSISLNGIEQEKSIKKSKILFGQFKESLKINSSVKGANGSSGIKKLGRTAFHEKILDYRAKYESLKYMKKTYPEIDIK